MCVFSMYIYLLLFDCRYFSSYLRKLKILIPSDMRNILVHCQDKTLALTVEDGMDLEQEIRSTFGLNELSQITLQHFSKEWNTWLSVLKTSAIPNMSEVRATVITNIAVIRDGESNEAGSIVEDICLGDDQYNKENHAPCTPPSGSCSTPKSICRYLVQ